MSNEIIQKLREELLNTSKTMGQELFEILVNSIVRVTKCCMCSLWSINDNKSNGFKSISLITRSFLEIVEEQKSRKDDLLNSNFVQEYEGSFIKSVIDYTKEKRLSYFLTDSLNYQRSTKYAQKLNLKGFIGIPIPDFLNKKQIIAVVRISYQQFPNIDEDQLEVFSLIVRDYFSSAIYRNMLLKKQKIMDMLIKNYQDKGQKKINDIFQPIIDRIFPEFCQSEGTSIFIWDSYNNNYRLLVTTGLRGIDKRNYDDVCYQAGIGLTGNVAKTGKAIIYDDLVKLENEKNPDYEKLYKEDTVNHGKTMMIVPILRPSNPKEIIGIIRFVNKINLKGQCIDYFNSADKELIIYASNYLALCIDFFLGEEERCGLITKLSHEFKTPANSIRITAERIQRKMGESIFVNFYLNSYLQSIVDYSDLQIMQASTNLYLSNVHRNKSKSELYNLKFHQLSEIIDKSVKIAIPFARDNGVQFDNIIIEKIPSCRLYIDESAFIIIFYNLLTNAIKYQNPNTEFNVRIKFEESLRNFIITVSDYGLGIIENEKEKIFLLGFRGKNIAKYNSDGYGIGLHVIYQIIKDFGGEIRVRNCSSPTTFEIILPKDLYNDYYTKLPEWK